MKLDLPDSGAAGEFSDGPQRMCWRRSIALMPILISHQEKLEKQSEELHELRRSVASVLGSVSEIMAVVDRDGRMEEVSASLARGTRESIVELLDRRVGDLLTPASAARLSEALRGLRLSREPAQFEAEVAAPTGPEPCEIALSAQENDDSGRLIGAVLVGRPLGELRQA